MLLNIRVNIRLNLNDGPRSVQNGPTIVKANDYETVVHFINKFYQSKLISLLICVIFP